MRGSGIGKRKMPVASALALLGVAIATLGGGRDALAELASGTDYGAGLTLVSALPLGEVLGEPQRHAASAVLVRAKVSEVCQRKGCWMILRDGEDQVRVRFADYGFFVPKDLSGAEVYAEGRVEIIELSQSEARHYESETKGGQPDRIQGPQRELRFTATGVRVIETR